jgi:tRNA A-37 threonylcarbamoyl transferase component Bud32
MISGNDDLASIARCIERGATDFLPKPYEPALLRARINACLEHRDSRRPEKEFLRDAIQVVSAAVELERGTYSSGSLSEVAERADELGTLARIFDTMAAGVRQREQKLRGQIGQLREEIAGVVTTCPHGCDDPPPALTSSPAFAGRYSIERAIGCGGMGTVYLAVDKEMGERVAIKTLRPKVVDAKEIEEAMEGFRDEIRLARQMSHRNIVRTHDLGSAGGISYVTMEFVQGTTLRSVLEERGRISADATLAIARQLTEALVCAHGEGIVHRDIKPENLLIDAAGTVKLMDFGIAHLADRGCRLTEQGMIVGTPEYMSPEQLLAERVDAKSDLYSVGVVLYECITGRPPFNAQSFESLVAKVLTEGALPPKMLTLDVPHSMSAMIMQLLTKDPAQRPQRATDLREILATIA